jgi:hypothetical protein
LIGRDVTRARERSDRSERRDRSIERRDGATRAGATNRIRVARFVELRLRIDGRR